MPTRKSSAVFPKPPCQVLRRRDLTTSGSLREFVGNEIQFPPPCTPCIVFQQIVDQALGELAILRIPQHEIYHRRRIAHDKKAAALLDHAGYRQWVARTINRANLQDRR